MKTMTCKFGVGLLVGMITALPVLAGNDKLMATKQAELVACRGLVESIYGVKVSSSSEVKDLVNGIFEGSADSKTIGTLRGYKLDEMFDEEKGVARVTASITMKQVGELTGLTFPDPEKEIRRVGFSTVRADRRGSIRALRAAELDAYSRLAERILGLNLESKSSVRNMVLQSDTIKAKVVASLFFSEMVGYGWDKDGNAHMTIKINLDDLAKILGQKPVTTGVVEVTGNGAAIDNYEGAKAVPGKVPVKKAEPMPPALPEEGSVQ